MADRDAILAYAAELLDLDAFDDFGPQGLQVVGSPHVERIVCAVSASRELFVRASELGANLVLVHHGILWDKDSRVIDVRMKGRLQPLFAADITLAAYHLALDAHPELGNNALVARALGIEVDSQFGDIGVGGRLADPTTADAFAGRARDQLGHEPLVFAHGPDRIDRAAVVTGGGARYVHDAAREGYDAFVTGEAAEPTLHDARELGIHFVAAGHYATERFGIQKLGERLAEHFGLEWTFVELPNPV